MLGCNSASTLRSFRLQVPDQPGQPEETQNKTKSWWYSSAALVWHSWGPGIYPLHKNKQTNKKSEQKYEGDVEMLYKADYRIPEAIS